jgi:hypothetical protein
LYLDGGLRVYMTAHRTRVEITSELKSRLEDLLGPGNLRLITTKPSTGNGNGNGRRWGQGQYQRAGAT